MRDLDVPALRQSLQGGLYKILYVASDIADMVGVTLSVLLSAGMGHYSHFNPVHQS